MSLGISGKSHNKDLAILNKSVFRGLRTFFVFFRESCDDISDSQEYIVSLMKKNGVDVILGTHSHTLQAIDYDPLKGTLVAYSLGDFFGSADRAGSEYSLILELEITKRADGSETGLAFHGVPGGHEFTSFILGLYNAAGPGQAMDEDTRQKIAAISKPTDIKILVTLSCTMCPDLVVAAQRLAAANPHITAHVYDIRHFEDLKNRYKVMSVPCMVVNDRDVFFGKKTIDQLLDLLR